MFAAFKINCALLIDHINNTFSDIGPLAAMSIKHVLDNWNSITDVMSDVYNGQGIGQNDECLIQSLNAAAIHYRTTLVAAPMGNHRDNFGSKGWIGLENKMALAIKRHKTKMHKTLHFLSTSSKDTGGVLVMSEYNIATYCKPNRDLEACALGKKIYFL